MNWLLQHLIRFKALKKRVNQSFLRSANRFIRRNDLPDMGLTFFIDGHEFLRSKLKGKHRVNWVPYRADGQRIDAPGARKRSQFFAPMHLWCKRSVFT